MATTPRKKPGTGGLSGGTVGGGGSSGQNIQVRQNYFRCTGTNVQIIYIFSCVLLLRYLNRASALFDIVSDPD